MRTANHIPRGEPGCDPHSHLAVIAQLGVVGRSLVGVSGRSWAVRTGRSWASLCGPVTTPATCPTAHPPTDDKQRTHRDASGPFDYSTRSPICCSSSSRNRDVSSIRATSAFVGVKSTGEKTWTR
jgi:hypothetical protein